MASENPSSSSPLAPLESAARVFQTRDHASLWFSLGVGLLVMQVGAYLVPSTGTRDAALAIVLGSLIGAGLLAWTARLGCSTGLGSAGLMQSAYGRWFARLPIVLNIVQLIGWTTFELVVMRDGTVAIAAASFGWKPEGAAGFFLATLLWGGILVLLMLGTMTRLVRRLVSRFMLPLVVLSLLWLTWQFGSQLGAEKLQAFWRQPGDGKMSMLSAMDLVIAMPVSWLPLVADYARYGQSPGGALRGTWLGYLCANIWCYALGVLIVSGAQPGVDLVSALLLAQGGLIALSLILIDEIDNAYGDTYSAAVSASALLPNLSLRAWGIGLAAGCTGLALVLPMHALEPFLLMLSSVFVPLYGVILGRMSLGAPKLDTQQGVHWVPSLIWLAGIACYHLLAQFAPAFGSALPTLALTFGLAWLTRRAT